MPQVVLITGASKGIGKAIANYLVERGMIVYGTSRSVITDDKINFLKLDVTDQQSVSSCIQTILEREGKIDVLINNAGNAIVGPLETCTVDDIKDQLDTNLLGVHRMVTAVLQYMKQDGGIIINIGSFGGRLSIPYQSLYSISKAALAMYTDSLRMENWTSKLRVCLIEPGDTNTDFHAGRINASGYDENIYTDSARAIAIMHRSEQKGTNPIVVAKTVYKAINARRPKPRYTTGFDAKIFGILMRFLPYKVQEYLIMNTYKVPRK